MIITVGELSQRFTIGKLQLRNYRCVTAKVMHRRKKYHCKVTQHQKFREIITIEELKKLCKKYMKSGPETLFMCHMNSASSCKIK
jgi:hypothetical protein